MSNTLTHKPLPESLSLRPHQDEALEAILAELQTPGVDRTHAIMACGTGKTHVLAATSLALESNVTVVVAPSLGLISQHIERFHEIIGNDINIITICSRTDASADTSMSYQAAQESFTAGAALSLDRGDREEIERNIRRLSKYDAPLYIFSTYISVGVLADIQAESEEPLQIDLLLADEAHHAAASAQDIDGIPKQNDEFGTAGKWAVTNAIEATSRLFVTATPVTAKTSRHAGAKHAHVFGNETVFGAEAYKLPFGEAIERGLLSPYQLRVPVFSAQDMDVINAKLVRSVELEGLDLTVTPGQAAAIASIGKLMQEGVRSFVCYHRRVEDSREFVTTLNAVFGHLSDVTAVHVDAKTDSASRQRILNRLRSAHDEEEVMIVSNCKVFTEGIDVPSLDAVVYVDTGFTRTDFVQSVGRAIRIAEHKDVGHIVVPFPLRDDKAERIAEASDGNLRDVADRIADELGGYGNASSQMRTLGTVLEGLADHDTALAEAISIAGRPRTRPVRVRTVMDEGFLPAPEPATAQTEEPNAADEEELTAAEAAANEDFERRVSIEHSTAEEALPSTSGETGGSTTVAEVIDSANAVDDSDAADQNTATASWRRTLTRELLERAKVAAFESRFTEGTGDRKKLLGYQAFAERRTNQPFETFSANPSNKPELRKIYHDHRKAGNEDAR